MIIPDKTGSAGKTEDAESNNYEQMTRAGLYQALVNIQGAQRTEMFRL